MKLFPLSFFYAVSFAATLLALQACSEPAAPNKSATSDAVLQSAMQNYQLVNALSSVNFLSVKKSAIVENHRFLQVEGSLNSEGQASITVLLDSLETLIPIRNERMREHLFNTAEFSHATVTAAVDNAMFAALAVGEKWQGDIELLLSLHGKEQAFVQSLEVIRLANNQMQVNSVDPLLVNAADFDLLAGINKLAELANLPSITTTVPVSVSLVFAAK